VERARRLAESVSTRTRLPRSGQQSMAPRPRPGFIRTMRRESPPHAQSSGWRTLRFSRRAARGSARRSLEDMLARLAAERERSPHRRSDQRLKGSGNSGFWRHARAMAATKAIAIFMVLVALGILTAPLDSDGQELGKVPRVGFLGPRSRSDGAPFDDAFLQ